MVLEILYIYIYIYIKKQDLGLNKQNDTLRFSDIFFAYH